MPVSSQAIATLRSAPGSDFPLRHAQLGVAIDVKEKIIIRDDALNDRAEDGRTEEPKFLAVYNRMHALLECLDGAQRTEGRAEQDEHAVPALGHGHLLDVLEREVFLRAVAGEQIFQNDHLILHPAET